MAYPAHYTVEQLLEVEQSYWYVSPVRTRTAAAEAIRTLPVALIVGLVAASSGQLPAPTASLELTRTELENVSHQTQEATTESAIFRRLVRRHAVLAPQLLPLQPDLESAVELGEYDYYDNLEMLPPNDPYTLVEVTISHTSWAEPEWKDLDAEFSFLADNELA